MAEEAAEASGNGPLVVVVVGAMVALAVLAAVLVVLNHGSPPPPRDRVAEARGTAGAWLRAWATDDRPGLRRLLVRLSPDVTATLDAFGVGLHPASIHTTAGEPTLLGDTATVPFSAAVELAGFGTWSYQGSVSLEDVDVPVKPKDRRTIRQWRVAFTPATIQPDLTPGRRLVLTTTWPVRAGLSAADGSPLAPGEPLRSLVGTVGQASVAQAKALGAPYEVGDPIGQSGLQAAFERTLAGRPTGEVHLVEGQRVVSIETTFPGIPAQPVRTTVNRRVLAAAQATLGAAGNGAALVAIQPSTGGILAIANRPGNGYDRALIGRYPPGSTFKVITTMALLARGVTPDTPISCPKEITVNGRTIANAEDQDLGQITFREAFIQSCNTAFIQLAQRLTPDDLVAAAHELGFDADPALGTAASTSQFPRPAGLVDQVSSAIGQGRVLATPLQMAAVAATVAASGYRKPHFVDLPVAAPMVPMAPETAPILQDLMRLVVVRGTGKKARLPGTPVAGKTGTAEYGTAAPLHTDAWFIAFRGDVAIAIVVEDGGYGADAAAPLAADFFSRIGG